MLKDNKHKAWDARRVRTLRRYLDKTQAAMAEELGVRQQTVSEWETGLYAPRGASAKLLGFLAERAGFDYQTANEGDQTSDSAQNS
jgi:DNA-binding transcriptional regulator YiaG